MADGLVYGRFIYVTTGRLFVTLDDGLSVRVGTRVKLN